MTEPDALEIREPGLALRALRCFVRCLPRGRSVAIRKLLPYVAPEHMVRGEFGRPTVSFCADLQQLISRTIFFYGFYEQNVTSLFLALLPDSGILIDVGAHIGYWTLLAASNCPGMRIISFEPAQNTFQLLERNVRLNGFKNIKLVLRGN